MVVESRCGRSCGKNDQVCLDWPFVAENHIGACMMYLSHTEPLLTKAKNKSWSESGHSLDLFHWTIIKWREQTGTGGGSPPVRGGPEKANKLKQRNITLCTLLVLIVTSDYDPALQLLIWEIQAEEVIKLTRTPYIVSSYWGKVHMCLRWEQLKHW